MVRKKFRFRQYMTSWHYIGSNVHSLIFRCRFWFQSLSHQLSLCILGSNFQFSTLIYGNLHLVLAHLTPSKWSHVKYIDDLRQSATRYVVLQTSVFGETRDKKRGSTTFCNAFCLVNWYHGSRKTSDTMIGGVINTSSIGIHMVFRTPILRLCQSFRGWIPEAKQVFRGWILACKQNLHVA